MVLDEIYSRMLKDQSGGNTFDNFLNYKNETC